MGQSNSHLLQSVEDPEEDASTLPTALNPRAQNSVFPEECCKEHKYHPVQCLEVGVWVLHISPEPDLSGSPSVLL